MPEYREVEERLRLRILERLMAAQFRVRVSQHAPPRRRQHVRSQPRTIHAVNENHSQCEMTIKARVIRSRPAEPLRYL